jgi:hypothetical protein
MRELPAIIKSEKEAKINVRKFPSQSSVFAAQVVDLWHE